jgi:competence protein ComEC
MPRRLSFVRLSLFQQPLLFIAISFICGLLFAARSQLPLRFWILFSVISWLLASTGLWGGCSDRMIISLLFLGCFAVGGTLWSINQADIRDDRVRKLFERSELRVDEPVELVGTLNVSPELAPDRIYLSISVERVATLGRERSASGSVQVVVPFRNDESRIEYDSLNLDYGTSVRLLGHLSNRHGYRNPGAPDFDEMLEYRGYDATGWVKSPLLLERLGERSRSRVLSLLYRVRARAITQILRSFKQPASGILAASLFGNRYFLSRETAETFRAGGTFHLLVISGLHVAAMAMIVLWLTQYLIRSRTVRYAIVLALVWAYASMVGAQPAITRSVVMLTIALIGQSIFRTAAGANTLAASAIALLAWQPRDLFNPAFQLSFLTVLIMVVLTAPLYQRFKQIGGWQPSAATPYPPCVPKPVKWCAEVLFWRENEFRREMKESRVRFRLNKALVSLSLNEMRLQGAFASISMTILTTTGVQIGLLPLMINLFHQVSVVAPIANVIEGALVLALMIAGAVYLVIHAVIGEMAMILTGAVNWLGKLTVKSCQPLLAWKRSSFRVPDFGELSALIFTLYFLAAALLIIVISEWNPLRKGDDIKEERRHQIGRTLASTSTLAILVLGWLLIAHPFAHTYDRGRLSVTFLDVGQGDGMLISFPRGSLMLLDAGGRSSFHARDGGEEEGEPFVEDRIGIAEAAVMPFLWRQGIKRLDWIVASHGDNDHVEGFAEIVQCFEVGAALKGPSSDPRVYPSTFDHAVRDANLPLHIVRRGDAIEIDGVTIEVLSPFAGLNEVHMSGNNGSLVLKISFGNRHVLLTGDIEKEAEARLVASETDLRADVLKVAHHGSRTSSTAGFVERVKPLHAVISAANPSPFGHPHPEVLARLRETGASIWQTGHCGAITVSTDGDDLRVDSFVRCK